MTRLLGSMSDSATLDELAELLASERCVGLPTDSAYAFVALATSDAGTSELLDVIGVEPPEPLTIFIGDHRMLPAFASPYTQQVRRFVEMNWPGPITLVLGRARHLRLPFDPVGTTVAIRIPNNEPLRRLLLRVGALASTTARVDGLRIHSSEEVSKLATGRIAAYAAGSDTSTERSSILDATGEQWTLLRPGSFEWPPSGKPTLEGS